MIAQDPNLYMISPEQQWVGQLVRITDDPEWYDDDPHWISADEVDVNESNMDKYKGCTTRVTRLAMRGWNEALTKKGVVWVRLEIDENSEEGGFTWDTRWLDLV